MVVFCTWAEKLIIAGFGFTRQVKERATTSAVEEQDNQPAIMSSASIHD
jgi:hypothetical protein